MQCSVCQKKLHSGMQDSEGNIYCSEACVETTLPTCSACSAPMRQWIATEDGQYCSTACRETTLPQCSACKSPMSEWIKTDDGQYCSQPCLDTALPTCTACDRPMSEWTETEGGRYCSTACLETILPTCAACDQPVNGGLTYGGEDVYCSEACGQTSWPQCDVCDYPMDNWTILGSGHHVCSTECAAAVERFDLGRIWAHRGATAFGAALAGAEYADQVILQAARGHGFAAEKANHMADTLMGKDAKLVGGDNAKNGADRLADGVYIQTKYCAKGSKCISECFEGGQFKYWNADGTPMRIEVPSDKYTDALKAMEVRIERGEVPGVSDPKEAANIVQKGLFTYEQVRNIARAGTWESLSYDGLRGIQFASTAFGISAALTFATAIWRGESLEDALEMSCVSGLTTFGLVWVTSVASSQVAKTGIERSLRPVSDYLVSQMGSQAASLLASGSGKTLVGAAAKNHVSKLLRGNAVTAAITTVIFSAADIHRLINGRISFGQAFKNISATAAGVVSGGIGAQTGAAIGATVGLALPIIGSAVGVIAGGFIGSMIAGAVGAAATNGLVGMFIEDDAKEMFRLFQDVLAEQAENFLLSEAETNAVLDQLQSLDLQDILFKMYAAPQRRRYAAMNIRPIIMKVVENRPKVSMPSETELLAVTKRLLAAA